MKRTTSASRIRLHRVFYQAHLFETRQSEISRVRLPLSNPSGNLRTPEPTPSLVTLQIREQCQNRSGGSRGSPLGIRSE